MYYGAMIGRIEGEIVAKDESSVIVNVNGVGYKIFLTDSLLADFLDAHGQRATFWIYTSVRENALELFGFNNITDKLIFERLLSVSGIGPKTALNVLTIAPAETLKHAVDEEDSSLLTKVSGIGPKSAKKIVIELKGKLDDIQIEGASDAPSGDSEVLDALQALGYTIVQARNALREISPTITDSSERIRAALKHFSVWSIPLNPGGHAATMQSP